MLRGVAKRLKEARAREKRLTRAINRLEGFAEFAEDLKLHALAKWAREKRKDLQEDRDDVRARIKRLEEEVGAEVPANKNGWHAEAERVQVSAGIGAFLQVPPRIVWHTTEGYGLPTYSGSSPHFTLDPKTGKLYQHIPITSGAMALKNLGGGVETNRAHAIQVELIGFAAQSAGWSDEAYANIAALARWIEKYAGVERRCSVVFANSINHMSDGVWMAYKGHCGHQHVPENDHWDPGSLRIDKILK
jgi:hypothetical protein